MEERKKSHDFEQGNQKNKRKMLKEKLASGEAHIVVERQTRAAMLEPS